MSNPFDYFDAIYCINLDERVDRWKHAQEEFSKVGILDRVKRFSAIKEQDGRVGVIKSNLEIVKSAKTQKLNNVLVFEDDVQFITTEPLKVLEAAVNQIQGINWHLFYLGANTHDKLIKFKPNLILLKNAFAVHSMAYNKLAYDSFIEKYSKLKEIKQFNDILDVFLAQYYQEKFICLMTNPMMTTQMNDYSDIEKRNVNQEYIEERFKNNIK
jgi:GR25 family glycosyltransferase involved in LPS biosynthesis